MAGEDESGSVSFTSDCPGITTSHAVICCTVTHDREGCPLKEAPQSKASENRDSAAGDERKDNERTDVEVLEEDMLFGFLDTPHGVHSQQGLRESLHFV